MKHPALRNYEQQVRQSQRDSDIGVGEWAFIVLSFLSFGAFLVALVQGWI